MKYRYWMYLALSAMILPAGSAVAQTVARDSYDVEYIGPRLPDPVLQHSKETYVLLA
jgi:hypothetical protein